MERLEEGARAAGDAHFGLSLAPTLHFRSWGPLGRYVSAGHSATAALRRLMPALPYHGAHDRVEMLVVLDQIRFQQLIRVQLLDGEVGAERAARQLGVGLRTVQRRLGADNTAFRDLFLRTRSERAVELLCETHAPRLLQPWR